MLRIPRFSLAFRRRSNSSNRESLIARLRCGVADLKLDQADALL
jgi:hypothetical protein